MNSVATDPRSLVCYIHINKNSGNTVRDVLDRNYPRRLGEFMLNRRTSTVTARPNTVDVPDRDVRQVIQAIRARQDTLDCVAVNLPYGLHRMLTRPVRYFTYLRDPVERCVSYWYWLYQRRDDPSNTLWRVFEAHDFDVGHLLNSGLLPQFSNDQTRFVTGCDDRQVTEARLHLAKALISERYAFVGAVERFAECHRVLADRFHWTDPTYGHLNHADRSDRSVLPANARELFAEHNQVDTELHRWLVETHLPAALAVG